MLHRSELPLAVAHLVLITACLALTAPAGATRLHSPPQYDPIATAYQPPPKPQRLQLFPPPPPCQRLQTRQYDPVPRNFVQPDPLGYVDSHNLFQGLGYSGLNVLDPFGLSERFSNRLHVPEGFLHRQKRALKEELVSQDHGFIASAGLYVVYLGVWPAATGEELGRGALNIPHRVARGAEGMGTLVGEGIVEEKPEKLSLGIAHGCGALVEGLAVCSPASSELRGASEGMARIASSWWRFLTKERHFTLGFDDFGDDLLQGIGDDIWGSSRPSSTGSPRPSEGPGKVNFADEVATIDGPQGPRSTLGGDCSYTDPAPTVYRNGLIPDTPVSDHIRARALGGHPTDPRNQTLRAWSENSRKGWHEGNYLQERARLVEGGLTPAEAEWVLEDYLRWIETDIHATPVAPEVLDTISSP